MERQKLNYQDLLGAKFCHGGNSIGEGFDCWSLAKEVYRRLSVETHGQFQEKIVSRASLPEYQHMAEQVMRDDKFQYAGVDALINEHKTLFTRLDRPEPFCIVTFILRPPFVTHIGVVLEDKRSFIHIMLQSSVSVERLDSLLWAGKIDGFWKYVKRESYDVETHGRASLR